MHVLRTLLGTPRTGRAPTDPHNWVASRWVLPVDRLQQTLRRRRMLGMADLSGGVLPGSSHATDLYAAGLDRLMSLSAGSSAIHIGLVDGAIDVGHPALADAIIEVQQSESSTLGVSATWARRHGTATAGKLVAASGTPSEGIAPACTLIVDPLFAGPVVTARDLARSLIRFADSSTRVVNLSLAHHNVTGAGERELQLALDYCADRRVLVVCAAGNSPRGRTSILTSHPWVISVASASRAGVPTSSRVSLAAGRTGLLAPGEQIPVLDVAQAYSHMSGSSIAAPFVTGTIALLLSLFPGEAAHRIHAALVRERRRPRRVSPPMLDAWRAYLALRSDFEKVGIGR